MDKPKQKSKKFLLIYTSVLLAAALALLTLSYVANMRASDRINEMEQDHTTTRSSIEQLQEELERLNEENAALEAEVEAAYKSAAEWESKFDKSQALAERYRDEADAYNNALYEMRWAANVSSCVEAGEYDIAANIAATHHDDIMESNYPNDIARQVLVGEYMNALDRLEELGFVTIERDGYSYVSVTAVEP